MPEPWPYPADEIVVEIRDVPAIKDGRWVVVEFSISEGASGVAVSVALDVDGAMDLADRVQKAALALHLRSREG